MFSVTLCGLYCVSKTEDLECFSSCKKKQLLRAASGAGKREEQVNKGHPCDKLYVCRPRGMPLNHGLSARM